VKTKTFGAKEKGPKQKQSNEKSKSLEGEMMVG
jgi:hypothetical protein